MMWQAIQERVRRAFSNAAVNYEVLTSLHKEIGQELVRKVVDKECAALLDVGTGTGYVANKAKFYFPEAMVIGLDFADGMIHEARKLKEGIQLVQADARGLPFKPASFDIILSNLAYQWVADLDGSFQKAFSVLKPEGVLCFTMFGYETLREIFQSLDAVRDSEPLSINRLATREHVEAALSSAGFRDIAIDYELIKIQFADLWDLLKWLKSIGANMPGRDGFIGRDLLSRANEYYKTHFAYHDGIAVTFEVIWVSARK